MQTSASRIVCCVLLVALCGCERPTPAPGAEVEESSSALTVATVQVDCGGAAAGSFVADMGFSGGATLTRTNTIDLSGVVNPAPAAVYQSQRYNNMSYTLSGFAAGALNDIRLHWADTKWTTSNQRLFNVTINGTLVLSNFDVIGAAGAPNKAVARTFTVAANSGGAYVIQFVGTKDAAMVSGIEIGTQIVGAFTHLNAGGPASGAFVADKNFTGGSTVTRANTIILTGVTNPAPAAVYQSQRFGAMSYAFPGFSAGALNNVRLHFADTKYTATNSRLFNVAINGTPVLTSFDVVAAAGGGNKAVVKELKVAASATGSYSIAFTAVKDDPMISGLEIVPLCSSVTLTTAAAGTTPTSKVQLTGAASCVAGVTPEYHFVFRDPASADDSWHDITPSFGGPTMVWDTNWSSTTPTGSSYQVEVLARAVNNAKGGETSAMTTLTLTSANQRGAGASCTSSAQCNDGVVTTVDTCSFTHCGVEPGAHGAQTVTSYKVPPTAATMTPVDPAKVVSITVGLPLRAPGQTLQAVVDAISNPTSPIYRHYLSASDLAPYLPSSLDLGSLVTWAQQRQLTAATNTNSPVITVTGTAAQIQKALYVHLVTGPRPDGTTFFGPDRAPSLDLSLPLLGVGGLDNYILPKPATSGGSGPIGYQWSINSMESVDLRSAYLGPAGSACNALTGTGQSVGLFAYEGFNPADITTLQQTSGLIGVPPVKVILAANNTACPSFGCADGQSISYAADQNNNEISLDIAAAMQMAPGAQIVLFQDANGSGNPEPNLNQVIANPLVRQVSSSWGMFLTANTPALLTIMAAQGQTMFNSSGDEGSADFVKDQTGMCVANPYSITPYTVMVGGTDLNLTNGVNTNEGIYFASAGGVLPAMPIPDYQDHINDGNGQVSKVFRNIPDVSLPGVDIYTQATTCMGAFIGGPPLNAQDCSSGKMVCGPGPKDAMGNQPVIVQSCAAAGITQIILGSNGTSASSPMWAGFMALINQNNAMHGAASVGFANPAFYAIAKDPVKYAAGFNDIASGEAHLTDCSGTAHTALAGYDLVTGIGSPRCGLLAELVNPSPTLGLTIVPTATGGITAPVSLAGTGTGFTPGGRIQFTVSGVPQGGGGTVPEYTLSSGPTADFQGNITYSIAAAVLPDAVFCQPSQRGQLVTLTAHDLQSKVALPSSNVFAAATFSGDFFCRGAQTLTAVPTATGLTLYPVWLRGTGTGFTPGGNVTFTMTAVPTVGGGTVAPLEAGDEVVADPQGNVVYSISPDVLPPAVVCQPNQQNQQVIITAHDLNAEPPSNVSATFSSNVFCDNQWTPLADVNLALGKPVFVHTVYPDLQHPGPLAVDGDNATYWSSQNTLGPEWITVDLEGPRLIHRVFLLWGAERFATDYQIQTSADNAHWTTAVTLTNARGNGIDSPLSSPVVARYVRVNMTVPVDPQLGGYSMREFQVWAEPAP